MCLRTPLLGTYEEINGIKTYVATPKTNYPKDKAVLYLPDVFGLELLNNRARHHFPPLSLVYPAYKLAQLLADDFARNGFKVYAPELFEGDPVSQDAFNPVRHSYVNLSMIFPHKTCASGIKFRSHEMAPQTHP